MDVESSQWWSTASRMSSCHHFIVATLTPNYQNLGQFCHCNHVRVHPRAYPQHMMVLKHFPYSQFGCGKQSVVFYSLRNVIMPSFHSSHAGPNYQKSGPSLPVLQCKGAPICLSTAYDGSQTLFIYLI
jgi:hypothetical protein